MYVYLYFVVNWSVNMNTVCGVPTMNKRLLWRDYFGVLRDEGKR